jgi:hypothetical protein
LLLLDEKILQDKVKLAKFNVPVVNVKPAVDVVVSAPPNVLVTPFPFTVTLHDKVLPLVVVVPVPENLISPVADQVVLATIVKLVEQLIVPVDVNVNALEPVVFRLRQLSAPVNVTVPVPERLSNITSSAIVGTDAPPAPPEVADQFVVDVVFQVPVPPRQYLSAICNPYASI